MEKNDAAEQFYHTYRSLIFRTAARLCRTQEDLDDLIQDSLLRFLKNLAYYTERNSDETSALIVLTMQCQKVDTFRKLHPEKMGRLGGRGHRGHQSLYNPSNLVNFGSINESITLAGTLLSVLPLLLLYLCLQRQFVESIEKTGITGE